MNTLKQIEATIDSIELTRVSFGGRYTGYFDRYLLHCAGRRYAFYVIDAIESGYFLEKKWTAR